MTFNSMKPLAIFLAFGFSLSVVHAQPAISRQERAAGKRPKLQQLKEVGCHSNTPELHSFRTDWKLLLFPTRGNSAVSAIPTSLYCSEFIEHRPVTRES